MATTSLFAKAKISAAPKESAKKMKLIVPVNMGTKLTDLNEVRDQIKTLEAKEAMLVGDIKPVASEQFLKLYKSQGKCPDSFVLQSASDGGKIMVIVQDRYLKVTPEKEAALISHKLEDVIEETTVFKFDPVLLSRYEKVISDAIMRIKSIPQADKDRLIVPETTKAVKKGTIDNLADYENLELVYSMIEPIMNLKNQ